MCCLFFFLFVFAWCLLGFVGVLGGVFLFADCCWLSWFVGVCCLFVAIVCVLFVE